MMFEDLEEPEEFELLFEGSKESKELFEFELIFEEKIEEIPEIEFYL
jgi:hypothetical protein